MPIALNRLTALLLSISSRNSLQTRMLGDAMVVAIDYALANTDTVQVRGEYKTQTRPDQPD